MKNLLRKIKYATLWPLRRYQVEVANRIPTVTAAPIGSATWLQVVEKKYGGFIENVNVDCVSDLDDRDIVDTKRKGMQGGDRMTFHGYAETYAKFLSKYLTSDSSQLTVIEIGILKGTGLAVWSELFPNARLIGLDIDLSNFRKNEEFLRSKGAFSLRDPEIYKYDQLAPEKFPVSAWLKESKIDICIDDGLHNEMSVINTVENFLPRMNASSVFIVEDYKVNISNVKKLGTDFGFQCFNKKLITCLFR